MLKVPTPISALPADPIRPRRLAAPVVAAVVAARQLVILAA